MPNVLASPRFWRTQAVLLKAEVTTGVDPTPTGAANWMEARNVSLTSWDATKVPRNIAQFYLGRSGDVITECWSKLSFDLAFQAGGAAGTAPKWSPGALACGYADTNVPATSDTYNLVSTEFGGATLYMNIDGTLYKFVGSRGNLKTSQSAGDIAKLNLDFLAIYAAPVASAMFTPITKTGWPAELGVNSVNTGKITINAVDLAFSKFDVDTGNKVEKINLPGPQLEAAITDRAPSASVTVLAPALGTFDPYALANAMTNVAVSTTHGTVAGAKMKTDLKVVITNVKEVDYKGMLAYDLTMEPTPVNGNDEITLTAL